MVRRIVAAFLLLLLPALAQETTDFRSPAEAAAVGYLRTVLTAERMYKKKHGVYAQSLAGLLGSGSFTRRMTRTDRGDYIVQFGASGAGFFASLAPKTFDAQHRAFFVDADGVVRVEDDKPATRQSPPLGK